MLRILHLSDAHGEGETMKRLTTVAMASRDCDVVACTGDCGSSTLREVPSAWNDWPQRLKLIVPGNHDLPDAFIALSTWVRKTPWTLEAGGLTFVGLDTAEGFGGAFDQLETLLHSCQVSSGLVVVSHRWPSELHAPQIGAGLTALHGGRPTTLSTLFVHGHDHPRDFSGSQWDPVARLGHYRCFRSHIASCAAARRGVMHKITWDGVAFSCQPS